MTSGVYQLTFTDGNTYIGKSINIEERYKQHMNKFYKGTAAKPMQAAYNKCGAPNACIIRECHEDHIDVVESCFIARDRPTLNSDRPRDPFPDLSCEQLNYLFDTFKYSARDLVAMRQQQEDVALVEKKSLENNIAILEASVESLEEEVEELTNLNDQLFQQRSEEEVNADISKRIINGDRTINTLHEQIKCNEIITANIQKELACKISELEYEKLPWWKKLFK